MKINKPFFWNIKHNFIVYILLPLSLLITIYIFFKKKITKTLKFKIPIICIGNIYVGGTGKTPLSIFLAKELLKLDKKAVILRKFYKSHKDEHELIKANFKDLIINKNRVLGIMEAEKHNYDLLIMDDGFQDYKIKKNLNILCFNSSQLIGNGFVLPAGPLRESLQAVKDAQIILINGEKSNEFEKKILKINAHLNIFYSSYKAENLNEFNGKKLLAISGIGNPKNFFDMLNRNNLKIVQKLIVPDHYMFSRNEIEKIVNKAKDDNLEIIMTEKDYYKVKHFGFNKFGYLKISLIIKKKEEFLNKIKEIYV